MLSKRSLNNFLNSLQTTILLINSFKNDYNYVSAFLRILIVQLIIILYKLRGVYMAQMISDEPVIPKIVKKMAVSFLLASSMILNFSAVYPNLAYASSKQPIVSSAEAGGAWESYAILDDGKIWAWGTRSYHLAKGKREVPSQAEELTNIAAITSSEDYEVKHALALKKDGTVLAWGYNDFGQLGDGSNQTRFKVDAVQNLFDVTAVSAGYGHSLALKRDGTVWAWGLNESYELGDGTNIDKNSPVLVNGLTDVSAISAGNDYNLAVKKDGTVWQWGSPGSAYPEVIITAPQQILGFTDIIAVSSNHTYSIALKKDGTVWQWGLGNGSYESKEKPVKVANLSNITAIDTGANHCLAIDNKGYLWAWGDNWQGQLGDGTKTKRTKPVKVNGISNVQSISAGAEFSLAVTKNGTIYAWGRNHYYQLGDGTKIGKTKPVKVVFDTTAPTVKSNSLVKTINKVPVNSDISVNFNENIQESEAAKNITLKDAKGNSVNISFKVNGKNLTVMSESQLQASTKYTLTIPANAAKDYAGNPLKEKYILKFTTAKDNVNPKLRAVDPGKNKTKVPINHEIIITFDEAVQKGSNFNQITLKDAKGKNVNINVTLIGNEARVKPNMNLSYHVKYILNVPEKAVKDKYKNSLAKSYNMSFTTEVKPPAKGDSISYNDLGISHNGKLLLIGDDKGEIESILGEAKEISGILVSNLLEYEYDGLKIVSRNYSEQKCILAMEISNEKYQTSRGLKVGDTKNRLIELYGNKYEEKSGFIGFSIYQRVPFFGFSNIVIEIDDDIIKSITLLSQE